jgi:hypothetical protein
VVRLDVLHALYLLLALLHFLPTNARLAPPPPATAAVTAARRRSQPPRRAAAAAGAPPGGGALPPGVAGVAGRSGFSAARLYGSLHLCAIYGALLMQLPGMHSDLGEWLLRLIGLWQPGVVFDVIPVAAALLVATVHDAQGKWLAARPPPGLAAGSGGGGGGGGGGSGRAAGPQLPLIDETEGGWGAGGGERGGVAGGALAALQRCHPGGLWRGIVGAGHAAVSTGGAVVALLVSHA